MPDIADGESVEMQGSGSKPYILKNTGGVYSCSCPAWRNQSTAIERRTCKHLRKYRGDVEEEARLGGPLPEKVVRKNADGTEAAGPPLLLAESWDSLADLTGWWMSEKLDGVRAYWDGKQFVSRLGNVYHAPDWFAAGLPATPLDGELWIDRKAFQRTVSIVRRQDRSDHWKEVRYRVFDAPVAAGAFEERLQFLEDAIHDWQNPYTALHEHEACRGLSHLQEELRRIEALGGEGLMLRKPGSHYITGRSSSLLKVKSFLDAEATIIGHEPGKGRHKGRLGALLVKLPNGKEFSVGTGFTDREREQPPTVGTSITFRYQELSDGGIPRFPSYVGLRRDDVTTDREAEAEPAATAETIVISTDEAPVAEAPKKAASKKKPAAVKAPTPKAAAPTPAATSAASTNIPPRYFEMVEGTASKFWEITRNGLDVTTRWGRIGTDGQSKTKTFATPEKAAAEYDKLLEEKTEKGYVEQGG